VGPAFPSFSSIFICGDGREVVGRAGVLIRVQSDFAEVHSRAESIPSSAPNVIMTYLTVTTVGN